MTTAEEHAENKVQFRKTIFKIILFFLLIMAPIIIIMVIMTPLAQKKAEERRTLYLLPTDFAYEDVHKLVANLRHDGEFNFYFSVLREDQIESSITDAFKSLDENRTQESLAQAIKDSKANIATISTLFLHLEIPKDFSKTPEQYPDLSRVVFQFLSEEFSLTILGVVYKSNYDQDFVFQWDDENRTSALKLQKLIFSPQEEIPSQKENVSL